MEDIVDDDLDLPNKLPGQPPTQGHQAQIKAHIHSALGF
jgi:hypothetical protein